MRGYFYCPLIDNFEWVEGWSAPFSLHALDRSTQVRTLGPSGELYARICRDNAVPEWAFGVCLSARAANHRHPHVWVYSRSEEALLVCWTLQR
jgi:hypothetical protein